MNKPAYCETPDAEQQWDALFDHWIAICDAVIARNKGREPETLDEPEISDSANSREREAGL